jgi:uncharacterized membrane protein
MKFFTRLIMVTVAPAFFYWTFPQTANACFDQGTGSTILQVFVAVLVGGMFLANHFRDKIKQCFRKLFYRGEEGKRG